MLVVVGFVILIISFIIALLSLISEERKYKHAIVEHVKEPDLAAEPPPDSKPPSSKITKEELLKIASNSHLPSQEENAEGLPAPKQEEIKMNKPVEDQAFPWEEESVVPAEMVHNPPVLNVPVQNRDSLFGEFKMPKKNDEF